jgi:hypothetical protein
MNDPLDMVRLFLSMGDHLEALREMRRLPKRVRQSVPALELHLHIFAAFRSFRICEGIVEILLNDLAISEAALEAIAEFRIAQAEASLKDGRSEEAEEFLRLAVKVWPKIVVDLEAKPELSSLL